MASGERVEGQDAGPRASGRGSRVACSGRLAAELAGTPILVNAACPGLTATWPGAEQVGARPVAASIVWAATIPDGGPSGALFRDGRQLAW